MINYSGRREARAEKASDRLRNLPRHSLSQSLILLMVLIARRWDEAADPRLDVVA
jgi:hypothetical protein